MLQVLRPIDGRAVYCQFAAAEVVSRRYGNRYEAVLGSPRVERLRSVPFSEWTGDDEAAAKAGVRAVRGAYVEKLMSIGPRWVCGQLTVQALADVKVCNYPPLASVVRSRRLTEFVQALESGADTPGDGFAEHYRVFRPTFDPSLMRGVPILVAESETGPYTGVEGLTRMCCLVSRSLQGESLPADIEVVVGTSPRVADWPWF